MKVDRTEQGGSGTIGPFENIVNSVKNKLGELLDKTEEYTGGTPKFRGRRPTRTYKQEERRNEE